MPVRSVTGHLTAAELGQVLPHEHVVIDYEQMNGADAPIDRHDSDRWIELLGQLPEAGILTLVDCTPPGYGRDLELLAELSRASGVSIIASTGSFCEQWSPQPLDVQRADVHELAATFTAELQSASGPGAGVIKVATSHGEITANEVKLLRAASAAHHATDVPIVAHTTEGLGLEQLDLYDREGVDPSAVLISHVCSGAEPVEYAIAIARRGAYVGLDRIGHDAHGIEHWVDVIIRLAEADLAEQILLSHDSVQRFSGPNAIAGHTFTDPLFLNRALLPALTERGFGPDQQHLLTHANPARWLCREETPR